MSGEAEVPVPAALVSSETARASAAEETHRPQVEATEEAKQRYNAYLKAGMGKTVWVGGCQSWYLDGDGDPAMWPYSWEQWVSEHEQPELDDFVRELPVESEPLRPAA